MDNVAKQNELPRWLQKKNLKSYYTRYMLNVDVRIPKR